MFYWRNTRYLSLNRGQNCHLSHSKENEKASERRIGFIYEVSKTSRTHYGKPGPVALARLAAVLVSCDAAVRGEGVLLLDVGDVERPEGGE